MALDEATLPLILYRKPGIYITIEHVLHCENIIHIPIHCFITLPFLLHFFISNIFSTCMYKLVTRYKDVSEHNRD